MNAFELKDPLVGLPMVTPLDEDENVDLDAAEFNLEKWKKTSVDIFVVGTASGEELYISENEKVEGVSITFSHLKYPVERLIFHGF